MTSLLFSCRISKVLYNNAMKDRTVTVENKNPKSLSHSHLLKLRNSSRCSAWPWPRGGGGGALIRRLWLSLQLKLLTDVLGQQCQLFRETALPWCLSCQATPPSTRCLALELGPAHSNSPIHTKISFSVNWLSSSLGQPCTATPGSVVAETYVAECRQLACDVPRSPRAIELGTDAAGNGLRSSFPERLCK